MLDFRSHFVKIVGTVASHLIHLCSRIAREVINLEEVELVSYRHQGVLWPCRGRTPERFGLVWPPNSKNPHAPQKENQLRVCDKSMSTGNSKDEDWVQSTHLVENLPFLPI